MHYRVPLYERMAVCEGIQLLVLHSDDAIKDVDFKFRTKYIVKKKFFGLTFQNGLKEILQDGDVILCMFDIKWISIIRTILDSTIAGKTFLWTHGYGRINLMNILRVKIVNKCKGLVLYYNEFKTPYIKYGVPEHKIYESSNTLAVDNHGFSPEITRTSFLYVGRLQERKKLTDLIIAFEDILKINPMLTLEFIGEGIIKENLIETAKRLNISASVNFHGKCTDPKKLKDLFQKSLAYVSPGHVGLGVLHAFAYGCPVITNANAYHAPEFVNIKNGQNSLLFDEEKSTLFSVMKMMIDEPGLSKKLGQKAYELYSTTRTIEVMVDNLVSLH